jgi:hypothetical protein
MRTPGDEIMTQTHIKSDLTNKTLSGTKMREISIPDETTPRQVSGNLDIDFDAVDALMRERNMPPVDRQAMQSQFNAQQLAKRRGLSDQEAVDLDQRRQQMSRGLSDDDLEAERQMQEARAARQAKLSGKERLSPGAKQRIEMLCEMSRSKREVSLDGNLYVLQNLKGKEQQEIWVSAAEKQNTVEFPFELRKQTLARALSRVADTPLDLFLGTSEMAAKLDFIDLLPEEILNKLYREFNELVDEVKEKYSIKTEAEATEVIESLKK